MRSSRAAKKVSKKEETQSKAKKTVSEDDVSKPDMDTESNEADVTDKMEELHVAETFERNPNLFQVMFYMKHFRVTDIIVKIVGRTVVIDASHKEHVDEHGFVSRFFVKKYNLPNDVLVDKLITYFTADGVLVIVAPREIAELNTKIPQDKVIT